MASTSVEIGMESRGISWERKIVPSRISERNDIITL